MISHDLFKSQCGFVLLKCQHELEKCLYDYPHDKGNIREELQNLMKHMADVQRQLETPTEQRKAEKGQETFLNFILKPLMDANSQFIGVKRLEGIKGMPKRPVNDFGSRQWR